jgi:hypothetical protein
MVDEPLIKIGSNLDRCPILGLAFPVCQTPSHAHYHTTPNYLVTPEAISRNWQVSEAPLQPIQFARSNSCRVLFISSGVMSALSCAFGVARDRPSLERILAVVKQRMDE